MKNKVILMISVLFISTLLLSVTRVQAKETDEGERIAGSDRYQTSIEISKFGWSKPSDVAIIATGDNFPDALSAAPLAGKYNAPILLTDPDKLDKSLYDELVRLKTKKVFIVGGTGVISKDIEDELTEEGIECERISGSDRYETSVAVASKLDNVKKAVLATGNEFPDALSVAPWAASNGVPILLTEKDSIPESVEKYIKDNKISEVYVIGGKGVISNDVMSKLPNPTRIEGEDRFATNLAVLKTFEDEFDFSRIFIATGNDFPDALSGSALACATKSPIILVDSKPISQTKKYINTKKEAITEVYIMGGEGVVSDEVFEGTVPPIVAKIDITVPSTTVSLKGKLKPEVNITMIPRSAAKPEVKFSVSDDSIAEIGDDGTITGLAPGSFSIIASAGGKEKAVDVKVALNRFIVLDPGHGGSDPGTIPKDSDGNVMMEYKESALNLSLAEKVKARLEDLGAAVEMTREDDNQSIPTVDRAEMVNELNPDLFLSIHHNSAAYSTAGGTETHYSSFRPNIDCDDVYALAVGSSPVYDDNGNVLGSLAVGQEYKVLKSVGGYIYISYGGKTGKVSILTNVLVYDKTPSEVVEDSKALADAISDGIASLGLMRRKTIDDNLYVTRMTNMVSVLVEVGFLSNPYERERIVQDSFQESAADKIVDAIVDFYMKKDAETSVLQDEPATP